jgi:transcriptional regulator with PAS, ATPase and Fis domain
MDVQAIKQRFGIIGNSSLLIRTIDIARQVAPTDLTVLITGESGTGKEVFPQIIHQLSARKHGPYIAVNCGAIPEGTIDSELFGHEKGSFTGAVEARKGYFEEVNGGTIFLDEVGELPLSTQVRLLRVLESGEFLKVGSSKVLKTNVRLVAATNVNLENAIHQGKFREDLYYRLNSVPVIVPPLRERKDDIRLLFRKFSADFAEKYRMPVIELSDDAKLMLENYRWPGNVRQLKNITEQISIIEQNRRISADTLRLYLPEGTFNELPMLYQGEQKEVAFSERDLLYKVLFDMKKDIHDLKKIVADILQDDKHPVNIPETKPAHFFDHSEDVKVNIHPIEKAIPVPKDYHEDFEDTIQDSEVIEESLSLQKKEIDMIRRALEKYNGKRKNAARELGISERTLYRKIKEYDIN